MHGISGIIAGNEFVLLECLHLQRLSSGVMLFLDCCGRTRFNKQAQKDFEPLVFASSPDQFKRRFEKIKAKNRKLAQYIE